jgi:hypothetical protein
MAISMFSWLEVGPLAAAIKMFPYMTTIPSADFVLVGIMMKKATKSRFGVCRLSTVSFLQRWGSMQLVIDPIAAREV